MPTDYDGNPRGFAFVQMEEEAAAKAIEELNGTELDGRTLTVNQSLPKGQKAAPKRKWNRDNIMKLYSLPCEEYLVLTYGLFCSQTY